ncbi:aromatic amino acid exporter [Acinetobacter venetianus]|uniref:Aromatic amino acid exporter n=1 Tax=Acinetobacter venetianus TaxID=52133 RepID=A0A150HSQ5_9GAMM|nr:DMT family transporter [Acinetobacter venetianus]KXZ69417.1 aromatic amino acid exporter [Acinetobacter venetianus]
MVQLSKYQKWAFVLPLIAVLIWSLNIAVTRYVADYISPVSISFYRWFVAFLILTPFMLPNVWKQRAVIGKDLGKLAVLSAFGMVLYQGLSYTAAHYTTATNMGIVNAFVPVFTIFISYLILKDVPNRFAIFGSLLSFAGLIYVMSQGHISSLFEQGGHWGDAVMVVAVGFYAFYGVFLKKWQLKLPLLTSLYVQIGFALLYHVPFLLWFGLDGINADNAASVLYAGVFPSLIAPLLWMVAVQAIGPNRTSIFMNLMPVFTAIIASLWLSEHWTIYHTIGGMMILVGIIMAQKKTIKVPSQLVETAS